MPQSKKEKNPNASTASSSSRPHPLTASKSPIHTTFYWRTSAPRFAASPSISGNIESCEVKSDALSYPGPVSMETTWFRISWFGGESGVHIYNQIRGFWQVMNALFGGDTCKNAFSWIDWKVRRHAELFWRSHLVCELEEPGFYVENDNSS
jgi:hypothetical protein